MAPGPENRQESVPVTVTVPVPIPVPMTVDKNHYPDNSISQVSTDINIIDTSKTGDSNSQLVTLDTNPTNDLSTNPQTTISTSTSIDEQEDISNLNERELEELLKEASTYSGSSRDREGGSSLFKGLLHKTEVDEIEEGRRMFASVRCIPGISNRRKHKRDSISSVSERLTHGGSLQNLAQPLNSEFDSSFAYLTSGSSHTYGGSRRKGKKYTGSNVSARQREGGSLPSNVNSSHNLVSLVNSDLFYDRKRGFCEEGSIYDWTNKEKSKSLDKPSYESTSKKDDKDNIITESTGNSEKITEKKCPKVKTTNEMLQSDDPTAEHKPDFMVIDIEVNGLNDKNGVSNNINNNSSISTNTTTSITNNNNSSSSSCSSTSNSNSIGNNSNTGSLQRANSVIDVDDNEGTEMKIIEPRRPMQLISRATFETVEIPVDSTIEFPLREHSTSKQDKAGKITINGTLQLTTYNNAKCVGNSTVSGVQQGKVTSSSLLPIMHVSGTQPNIAMAVSRLTAQNTSTKDFSMSIDKKSLDENGNAVQSHNGERKKTRRKHTQEPNVIIYKAENVEGHRNYEDIDSLINFIENKESKVKKGGKTGSNSIKVKTSTGTKPRSKDSKRDSSKLHKSNSLEEISKTKLEDLTVDKNSSNNNSNVSANISNQHGSLNGALRRAKQRSTGDSIADCRGDRRSWGTEEGQSIYCNDIGDEYTSSNNMRRNSTRKINTDTDQDPEFLVVTKKKKNKRQRRSSSGSRAHNLTSSTSYLRRSRDFNNEYRRPLSPELRRKSTSSMPPSDKSDSSDLDSVHSLPVTSNSTKHNINKNQTNSRLPQASYADIARMATISQNSVINISSIVPNMLNTSNWPAVPGKSPSEPDKFPQDYYPSLDELQQSDRKLRQHNFVNSNHLQGLDNLTFDKNLPSNYSNNSKSKNISESKKAEAREEAINKKIQVIKYVQEQKNLNANSNYNNNNNNNSNCNNNQNELISSSTKLKSAISFENNSVDEITPTTSTTNELLLSKITNHQRPSRKNHQNQPNEKKNSNNQQQADNCDKKSVNIQDEFKKLSEDNKKIGNITFMNSISHSEDQIEIKSKSQIVKSGVNHKTYFKESQSVSHGKLIGNQEEVEIPKRLNNRSTANKDVLKFEVQSTRKNPRPAVILMDENLSDSSTINESPSELTFGFAVNEQLLLLANDNEIHPKDNNNRTVIVSEVNQEFNKPSSINNNNNNNNNNNKNNNNNVNFDKSSPLISDKQVKFPIHFQVHPSHPYTHLQAQQTIIPATYLGYPRFQSSNNYIQATPTTTTTSTATSSSSSSNTPTIPDKHQPKEDFSARYVAPEDNLNVQNYNHDKIVTFVGLAWDAVMREMPVTAATGRVQYYSGQ